MDGMISLAGFLSEKVTTCIGQEPFNSIYTIEGDIARGKFAVVKRCRHCITGQEFAAKFLKKRRLGRDVRHEILHEMAVLEMGLTNPRIINLHEVYETNRELILVLELATGGELQQLIDELDECLKERDVIRLMRQILEGLSFLHDRNIVHLDIKPQNILLSTSFPHGDVKLCDFGISRLVSSGCEVREILGTPDYVAPEILSYEPISTVTDMWSIGVLAYVLLTGHSPFAGENKQETYCNIAQCNLDFPEELFNEVSLQAQDFIRRLLIRDPASRATARDCLIHPWLRPETELALVRSPFGSPSLRRPHPPCDQENLADEGGFPKRPKFSEGFDGGFMFDEGVVC